MGGDAAGGGGGRRGRQDGGGHGGRCGGRRRERRRRRDQGRRGRGWRRTACPEKDGADQENDTGTLAAQVHPTLRGGCTSWARLPPRARGVPREEAPFRRRALGPASPPGGRPRPP